MFKNFNFILLVIYSLMLLVPLAFDIGESRPAYTLDGWLLLTGAYLTALPAFLGFMWGKDTANAPR